jgi:PAS domain S-box-containing protein
MENFNSQKQDLIAPDGIAVINSEQKIIAFNEAGQRITGLNEKDIIFRNVNDILDDHGRENKYLEEALKKGHSFSNISLTIYSNDHRSINILASITPLTPPEKGIVGAIIIFRNAQEMASLVNSLHQKNLELQNEKNKLQAIFDSRLEGTFTIDENWKITSFNLSAQKITGYSIEEATGKYCWSIFQSKVCRNGCHMECTMKNAEAVFDNELIINRKDGRQLPVRINSAPLFDASGKQIGGVETFQDLTEIKNLATHLEDRFQFDKIIGRSKIMQNVYALIESVAPTDSTVLITGESGTGKELVARAIHLNSERKLAPFVAINCSAFVETLLESELFGHEKGAFTGAIRSKPGRFELADKGTLFLDEIGDLSPAVQVKLLRVLETQQFERVGGTKPIKVDVRILTATHRNLEEEIKSNRFREDLYYRLNVINIHLPPLRERKDDIPYLVNHFIEKFRSKFNKPIEGVSPSVLH